MNRLLTALALACLVALSFQSPLPSTDAKQAAAAAPQEPSEAVQLAPLGAEKPSNVEKRDAAEKPKEKTAVAEEQKPAAETQQTPIVAEADTTKRAADDEQQPQQQQRPASEDERREAFEAVEIAKRATGGEMPKEVIIEEV